MTTLIAIVIVISLALVVGAIIYAITKLTERRGDSGQSGHSSDIAIQAGPRRSPSHHDHSDSDTSGNQES